MSLRYIQTFCVIPKTSNTAVFPLDMLRYDTCFFASETDARRVEAAGDLRVKGEVKLKRYVETKHDIPTDARWSSFGWIINGEVETRKLP